MLSSSLAHLLRTRSNAILRIPLSRRLSSTTHAAPSFHTRLVAPISIRPPTTSRIYAAPFGRWFSTSKAQGSEETNPEKEQVKPAEEQPQQQQTTHEQSQAEQPQPQTQEQEQIAEVEEPEFRKDRPRAYYRPQPQPTEIPKHISPQVAMLYLVLGIAGLAIVIKELVTTMRTSYREASVDIFAIVKEIIEEAHRTIQRDSELRKRAGEVFIEDPMITFQVFGDKMTITFPIIQQHTASRCGTVYIDMQREGDNYSLADAYIDFVAGTHMQLNLPENYALHIFDPKFSVEESMRQMQLQEQEYRKREMEQRQKQQQAAQAQPARR